MAYYLEIVDFLNPESREKCNVTDLVKAYKFFCRLWNQFIPTYGNDRQCDSITSWKDQKDLSLAYFNISDMIDDCIQCTILLKDLLLDYEQKDFEKYSKVIDKYKSQNLDGKVFNRKIYIQEPL